MEKQKTISVSTNEATDRQGQTALIKELKTIFGRVRSKLSDELTHEEQKQFIDLVKKVIVYRCDNKTTIEEVSDFDAGRVLKISINALEQLKDRYPDICDYNARCNSLYLRGQMVVLNRGVSFSKYLDNLSQFGKVVDIDDLTFLVSGETHATDYDTLIDLL